MPAKEYSCTINLGFVLKCVTTGLTFRKGPPTPAFKFSHLHGLMALYNITTIRYTIMENKFIFVFIEMGKFIL